jgi:hypothetical protein
MNTQELKSTIESQPFQPFRIHFGSGRSLDVPHREFVSISPSGRTAIVYTSVSEQGDAFQIVDVMLIESIEFLKPKGGASEKGKNGTH